jgi:catechol 2,3-dioxygenase-like lactoylglutathione lyase family enzyme
MTADLDFVELMVASMPAALAWYRDVLGLEVLLVDEAGGFALLRAGRGRIALKAGTPAPGSVLLTFAVADLDAALTRLVDLGVTPEGPVKHSQEGYRRVLLRDLDGYRLCLFDRHVARTGE